jgi:DNA polymerase III psi subunit
MMKNNEVQNSPLFDDIVRSVKFTADQVAFFEYYRKEQWDMQSEFRRNTSRVLGMLCLLIVAQCCLLVFSSTVLQQRVDYIEKRLLQESQIQENQHKGNPILPNFFKSNFRCFY